MNSEIKAYISIEVKIAAAFNFFINGMISSLIYHKADMVQVDAISLAIDFTITCLCIYILTSFFIKASLKRTNTAGILAPYNKLHLFLGKLFKKNIIFGILLGFLTALTLFAVISSTFGIFGIKVLSFDWYIAFKPSYCALLGAGAAVLEMISGMCKAE